MATSPAPQNPISVNDFVTSLRSQYAPVNTQGDTTINFNNITKDVFNNGVIGVGYGAADAVLSRTVPPKAILNFDYRPFYNGGVAGGSLSYVNVNPSNAQAARVIRGLGQALGCAIDLGEAVGNVSNGNNNAAVCNIASCIGGVGGGWGGAALGSGGGPLVSFGTATLGGYVGGKGAEYLCKKYFGINTVEDASQPGNVGSNPPQLPDTVVAPLTGSLSATAANIVRFRASPDYKGDAGSYSVAKDETLTKVARDNGVSLQDLLASNPQITSPNDIRTGQLIRLPESALNYVPGSGAGALPPTLSGIPEINAQIDSLTQVLGTLSGDFTVITENSGRIAVINVETGSVTSRPCKIQIHPLQHD